MENFVVSARKYRPITFDTVVGQEMITNTLKNAIKTHTLAHAFLFCGPRGVGKTTCARIFAKTINCEHPTENTEACDECESCRSFNQSASFNIYELDAASNNSVDDIRALVEQVRIPPQAGNYKVYIIDEVHMLSNQAFNAFLKTLEEPPAYAKFILATTEKHKIIPTILSRCQIFDFKRITVNDIARHLSSIAQKESVKAEPEALHIIAQKADGALRDALSIFDQMVSFTSGNLSYSQVIDNLNVLDYDYYFKVVDNLILGDITQTILILNEILEKGFDGLHFVGGFGEHLRNLLMGKRLETFSLMDVSESVRKKYIEQAQKADIRFLMKALDLSNKCDLNYRNAGNKRLLVEVMLLNICAFSENFKNIVQQQTVFAPPASPQVQSVAAAPQVDIQAAVTTIKQDIKQDITDSHLQEAEKKKDSPVENIPQPKTENISQPKVEESTAKAGSFSIKASMAARKAEQEKQAEALKKEAPEILQETLEELWQKFAETQKDESPNFYKTLKQSVPQIKSNHVIEYEVVNKVQEEEIKNKKVFLLSFLKQETNNFLLSIETIVAEQIQDQKPYSPTDKYLFMYNKNPELKFFKEELNLDLDF